MKSILKLTLRGSQGSQNCIGQSENRCKNQGIQWYISNEILSSAKKETKD